MQEIKEFSIGSKKIGLSRPVFISAEVGTTCNGDVETAKKLIDAAKDAGMDAVKFQVIDPEDMFSDRTIPYSYTRFTGEKVTENLYEMLQQYVMKPSEWKEISVYAKKRGIIMFATPDSNAGIDLMESLDMPAYKISTWDVSYYPFVRRIARIGKPVIVDLGASDMEETARIMEIFKEEKNDKIILLHCFHTHDFSDMNLRTIEYLRDTFGCFSGFSAPDANNAIDYVTLPYKPVYIEKRLTLNREDPLHHHARAVEPDEMKDYVRTIRELESALGKYALIPTETDVQMRQPHFRSIVASRPIKKGELLTHKNITCRRPFKGGIDPKFLDTVVGRKATKNIKENEQIQWENI